MMENQLKGPEINSVDVTKRKSTQEDNTSTKKMKAQKETTDDCKREPNMENNLPEVSDLQNSSATRVSGTSSNTETGGKQLPMLSKRQRKKERKNELYRAGLALRRAKEKEKVRQKKREAKLNNVVLGPSRKELKRCTMANSRCKVRVAIDMSFDHLMNEKDLGKCVKQLLRCYSANRRAKNPLQLYVTSFDGKTKDAMAKNTGYNNWDVHFQAESYLDLFDCKDIVYLTSDSENILHEVQDDKVYVIGGLVDHNSQKGLTLEIAEEKSLHHAQLPIENFLEMKTRKVLSVVHVFEILLFVSEGMSWKDALLRVMPARKGAAEKPTANMTADEYTGSISEDVDHAKLDEDSPAAGAHSAVASPPSSLEVVTEEDYKSVQYPIM